MAQLNDTALRIKFMIFIIIVYSKKSKILNKSKINCYVERKNIIYFIYLQTNYGKIYIIMLQYKSVIKLSKGRSNKMGIKNILIEYPKCSTCQKAKKFLEENKIEFIDRNIITETPTYEELKEWIEKSGLTVSKFFNTTGLLYRNMNLKEELKNCSDDEKIRILSSNGMLIKRPILLTEKSIIIGFKREEWEKIDR